MKQFNQGLTNDTLPFIFPSFSHTFALLPFFVIMMLNLTANMALGSSENQGNNTDHMALLAIKSQLASPPGGVFMSWNLSNHHCKWEGVSCGRRHNRVTALDLSSRSLVGSLSPFIGNLSFLTELSLYNNSLRGHLPPEISSLFRLRELKLNNNTLTGEIPANLSGCINLEIFDVSFNRLKGQLPVGIGALTKLRDIGVDNNHFTGPLFKIIGNLTSLEQISGTYNSFTGTIDSQSIARMKNLTRLELFSNKLVGLIPISLFNHSSLQMLDLALNNLHGSLPPNIALTLPQLQYIELAENHLSGPFPGSISNLTNLVHIGIRDNNFTGKVQVDFGRLQSLQHLDLSYNQLEGGIDFVSTLTNCRNMEVLDLRGNRFQGRLPKSVANLSPTLAKFGLGGNQLSGDIPAGIGNLINLILLYMDDNEFTGTIPQDLGNLQHLERLYLFSNKLTGRIPNTFNNMSRLGWLNLADNKLQGSIPPSLGGCQNLLYMSLAQNDLNGTVPKELFGGSTKFLFIDISQNQLEGSLPSDISQQISLQELHVSRNKLSGDIPNGLGSCRGLLYLFMEANSFHGHIPFTFTTLGSLQIIDLSDNNLSGSIPEFFSRFPLVELNLSYNSFEGGVPTTGVFMNASAISLMGNKNLCGGIPELHLLRCKGSAKKRRLTSLLKVITPVISILAGVVIIAYLYLYFLKKRKSKSSGTSSGFQMKETVFKVSYNTLLKATDGFSSENLLGRGTFGSVFKGTLEPNGKIVAIKVLHLQHRGASKSFMAECLALRNIRHRNLVRIETACSSIDHQGNEFKALVYEFMPNGSLDSWLHDLRNLTLLQRLDIAMDVACALNYLHHESDIPIVHCDLKPSNILLDNAIVAHVGDFGLAKILVKGQNTNQSSSVGVRGTVGYAPPEYGLGGEPSTEGDIYSFGILLLELMTGKRPTDDMFEEFNLHVYAREALPDQVLEIVDQSLHEHEGEEENNRRRSRLTPQQRMDCMVLILNVGVACSHESPHNRPKIADAMSELQLAKNVLSNAR